MDGMTQEPACSVAYLRYSSSLDHFIGVKSRKCRFNLKEYILEYMLNACWRSS